METTIVCAKWGAPYSAEYVNVLASAVRKFLHRPHRFVCVTDDASGISPEVQVINLPSIGIPQEKQALGGWPKLHIFSSSLMGKAGPVIYMDLDMIIVDRLDGFVDRLHEQRGLHIVRRHNRPLEMLLPASMRPDRGGNGSVIGYFLEEQSQIYDDFAADMAAAFSAHDTEQEYITAEARNLHYWPDQWCPGFKSKLLRYYPLSIFHGEPSVPDGTKIVVMAGKPKPKDVILEGDYVWGGSRRRYKGPVSWIQDYWTEHGDPKD